MGQAGIQHEDGAGFPEGSHRGCAGQKVGHGKAQSGTDGSRRGDGDGRTDNGTAHEPALPVKAEAGAGSLAGRRHPPECHRANGQHRRQNQKTQPQSRQAVQADGGISSASIGAADTGTGEDRRRYAEVHDRARITLGERGDHDPLRVQGIYRAELFPHRNRCARSTGQDRRYERRKPLPPAKHFGGEAAGEEREQRLGFAGHL